MTTLSTTNGAMSSVSQLGILRSQLPTPNSSPIHLSKHGIDGTHDRDDVGDLMPGNDVRQDRQVRERGAAPLHAIWLRAAVGNHVGANLATRPFDACVRFALGDSDLRDRLQRGTRRDWSDRQLVQSLPDDSE